MDILIAAGILTLTAAGVFAAVWWLRTEVAKPDDEDSWPA